MDFDVQKQDTLQFIITTSAVIIASELLTFLLFFRNTQVKQYMEKVKATSHKINRLAYANYYDEKKVENKKNKKLSILVAKFANYTNELAGPRQKTTILLGLAFLVIMPFLYSQYEGLVLAQIPFTPTYPFSLLFQATLGESNPTDCSFTFIFTSMLLVIKSTIQYVLDYAPVTNRVVTDYTNSKSNSKSAWNVSSSKMVLGL